MIIQAKSIQMIKVEDDRFLSFNYIFFIGKLFYKTYVNYFTKQIEQLNYFTIRI